MVIILLLLAGCTGPSAELDPPKTPFPIDQHTLDEGIDIAKEYIIKAPTFTWDGMPETLEVQGAQEGDCTSCYVITITFDSRHGGYGDRTGMMVTQMITPHTAIVQVREGKVESATLDGRWDEMKQKGISNETPPPQITIAEGT